MTRRQEIMLAIEQYREDITMAYVQLDSIQEDIEAEVDGIHATIADLMMELEGLTND